MILNKILNDLALRREVLAYIAVGVLGAFVDFGVFYLFLFFNDSVLFAQWLGALAGFTHNHIWQHYKVFVHNQCLKKTYLISLVVSVISMIISGPLLLFLNKFISVFWFNKVIILGLTFIVLYVIKKKWIFVLDARS